jgi:hypothetical protein
MIGSEKEKFILRNMLSVSMLKYYPIKLLTSAYHIIIESVQSFMARGCLEAKIIDDNDMSTLARKLLRNIVEQQREMLCYTTAKRLAVPENYKSTSYRRFSFYLLDK